MVYIALGCLGFLVIHLADIVSLKRLPGAKPFSWIVGSGLLVYAIVMVCLQPGNPSIPTAVTYIGGILAIISFSILISSLFLSLPFQKTYIATGVNDKLVTTGFYSLVRHPGVIWYALFMLSLVLIFKSNLLLLTAAVFIFLDTVLVVVQDRFIFSRIFTGYDTYRQNTPMLLPNRRSINAFVNSFKQSRAQPLN